MESIPVTELSPATIAWSINGAFAVLLGMICLFVWLQWRTTPTYLLASIMAIAAGFLAFIELTVMKSASISQAQMGSFAANIAIFAILVPMVWFVRWRFTASSRWMAIAITAIWSICLIANFLLPGNLTFASVDRLDIQETFWGERFAFPVGTASSFKIVADLASLLVFIYLVDATVRSWRTGDRRSPKLGLAMIGFILIGGIHTPLVDAGIIATPYMISFAFTGIILALMLDVANQTAQTAKARREAKIWKERWDDILARVQLAIVGVDRGGRIAFVNERLLGCAGYERTDLVGRLASEVVPELDHEIRSGTDRSSALLRHGGLTTAAGERRSVVWSFVALSDEEGAPDGYLAIGDDITELRNTRERMDSMNRELERVSRGMMLGELGASLAHDLNQPLAAIMSNAQAAQNMIRTWRAGGETLNEALSDIVDQDRRAAEIIKRYRNLLVGKHVDRTTFDLIEAVNEVLELLSGRVNRMGVDVQLSAEFAPFQIYAGRLEIQQILTNLMLNGIRAAAAGKGEAGGLVRVQIAHEGSDFVIVVADNGSGVRDDIIGNIFDPFFSTHENNMGMGLAISRRIADAHDGGLEYRAGETGGSEFRLSIPANSVQAHAAE